MMQHRANTGLIVPAADVDVTDGICTLYSHIDMTLCISYERCRVCSVVTNKLLLLRFVINEII